MVLRNRNRLKEQSAFMRYAAAILITLAALSLNFAPQVRPQAFFFFYAAVALTARYCGAAPAALSTVLSAILADYYFLGGYKGFAYDESDVIQVIGFVLVCAIIISIARQRSYAEDAEQARRNQLAAIVESSEDAILSKTMDGRVTSWNAAAERLYQYKPEEIIGKSVSILMPDPRELDGIMQKLARGERIQHYETIRQKKDGSRVQVWVSISPVRNSAGEIVGAAAIARDITVQKLAEAELRMARRTAETAQREIAISEQRLQFAQRAASLGSWEWNVRSGEVWWSEGVWPLYGYAPQAFAPSYEKWMELVFPEDREHVGLAVAQALEGRKDFNAEYRVQWPDGSLHWIVARGQVIASNDGTPEKMIGVGIDISERKHAEETLRRTEKLAAAGRLAATVAHEINNPLESVTNLIYLAKRKQSDPERSRYYLAMADEELGRVAHIARQTLGFYRDTSAPVTVDIMDLLDDVLNLYRRKLQSNDIKLQKLPSDHVKATVLAGEIRQLLSNLIVNAADAMPSGGTLAVRVRRSHDWSDTQLPGVKITVADTGGGIQPEHLPRLFEPFFSTKGEVGTGLGLWLSKSIVERHGGRMKVKSRVEPGRSGTVFSVFIPAQAVPTEAAAQVRYA